MHVDRSSTMIERNTDTFNIISKTCQVNKKNKKKKEQSQYINNNLYKPTKCNYLMSFNNYI